MSNDWKWKKLGDECIVTAGQSPEGKYYNKTGTGTPFYQGKKEFTDKYINNPTVWTSKITKEAYEGDILMSVRAPVGPVNFATQKICIGRGLASIRVGNNLDKDFLFMYLSSIQGKISGNAGAVFPSINKSDIQDIQIPIPTISEQRRIVKILDEAVKRLETVTENTKKNIDSSKKLFGIFSDNIFSKSNYDWIQTNLKELTNKIGSGSTPKGGSESYKKSGISLIRSMNVHDYDFRHKELAHIDEKQAVKLANVGIQKNDILFNITGASVARCCIVPDSVLPARVNQHVSIIRVKEELINHQLLQLLLSSKFYKDQLLKTGEKGGSTRQAITKTQLENFRISFPKNMENQQQLVVEILSMKECTILLQNKYKAKIKSLHDLKESILTQAFSGNL